MRKLVIPILAISLFTGCATSQKREEHTVSLPRHSGSKGVATAVEMLRKGDAPGAAKVLKAVCKDSARVTDEALFRLALLSLKPNAERPASRRGQELLKRLKREYPASPWTAQAMPLIKLIKVADELVLQNKSLKAANESLKNKIDELNHSMEQLKHLDLELEQKAR